MDCDDFCNMMMRYEQSGQRSSQDPDWSSFLALAGDNKIIGSSSEIKKGMAALGAEITDEQAKKIFDEADENKDGKVDFQGNLPL